MMLLFLDTDTSFDLTLERDGDSATNSDFIELCANASDSDGDDLTYMWFKDEIELVGQTLSCIEPQVTGGLNVFDGVDYTDGDTIHSFSVTVSDSYLHQIH